ncbi:MAG: Bax inhibitor-1 family protein [Acidocella sp.]|nr:Bax inhibitor-1 family protein [Acidocella sp.]
MTMNTEFGIASLATRPASDIVSKTYSLLTATVGVSAMTAFLGMRLSFAYQHPFILMLLAFAALFAVLMTGARDQPIALPLVFVFTGLMGLSLGPAIAVTLQLVNGPQIVAEAAGGTAVIFAGLSLYAAVSKRDFSIMGGFLMTGLIIIILAGIANFWLRMPVLQLAIAAAALLIFAGYTLIDTQRLLRGGETRPVLIVVALYLDILNIFVALLELLTSLQRRR